MENHETGVMVYNYQQQQSYHSHQVLTPLLPTLFSYINPFVSAIHIWGEV